MKQKRKGSLWWWVISIILLGVVVGLIVLHFFPNVSAFFGAKPSTINADGMNVGGAPWPAETAHLKDRLAADELPALKEEGEALHIHQHLDILLDTIPVQVPEGIGINERAGFIAPIHTHDTTGVIHVESPTVQDFTLGQFFDIWGVEFNETRIGGYYNTGGKTLHVYVNGEQYQGDPRQIVLTDHQEIAIIYGTDSEVPKGIPSSYNFPAGL
jgi:hypothetical protein